MVVITCNLCWWPVLFCHQLALCAGGGMYVCVYVCVCVCVYIVPDPLAKPSIKDYVLVKQRHIPSVLDTRVYRGVDLNSDHRLVIASLQLKVMRKKGCPGPGRKFEVELLKEVDRRADYMESIEKCFKDRKGEVGVEKRWKELRNAIVCTAE